MTKLIAAVELMRKEGYTKEEMIALVNEALEVYEKGECEMTEPYFEAWALMGNDNKLSGEDETGIGMVSGYDYGHLEHIQETGELWEALNTCYICPPAGTKIIGFTITDLAFATGDDSYSTMCVEVKEYIPADISSVPSDFVVPY